MNPECEICMMDVNKGHMKDCIYFPEWASDKLSALRAELESALNWRDVEASRANRFAAEACAQNKERDSARALLAKVTEERDAHRETIANHEWIGNGNSAEAFCNKHGYDGCPNCIKELASIRALLAASQARVVELEGAIKDARIDLHCAPDWGKVSMVVRRLGEVKSPAPSAAPEPKECEHIQGYPFEVTEPCGVSSRRVIGYRCDCGAREPTPTPQAEKPQREDI